MAPLDAESRQPGRQKLCLLILALGLVAAQSGCGPVRSPAAISQAERELARIDAQGAGAKAPYEMQAARCSLDQARRKWAVSQFESSILYAEQALKWTQQADGLAAQQAAASASPAKQEPRPASANHDLQPEQQPE